MKVDLSQPGGHCWVFQVCWHTECSMLTASSFRIWKSLAGILSLPLALFVVMLPKAQLTSHSRMSGSRWVITPSWLSGSLRPFFFYFFFLQFCIVLSYSRDTKKVTRDTKKCGWSLEMKKNQTRKMTFTRGGGTTSWKTMKVRVKNLGHGFYAGRLHQLFMKIPVASAGRASSRV